MSIALSPTISNSLNQGLSAYQLSKARGENSTPAPDARALLRAEQEAQGMVSDINPELAAIPTSMTREEVLELQRSWGLITGYLGTQVDVFV